MAESHLCSSLVRARGLLALTLTMALAATAGCGADGTDESSADDSADTSPDVVADASDDPNADIEPDLPDDVWCDSVERLAAPVTPGVEVFGTSEGESLTQPTSETCSGGVGAEAVYWVETERQVDLLWEITPDFDGVAYIRDDCDGLDEDLRVIDEPACADLEADLGFERAELFDAPPGTYFLFVDGFDVSDAGSFSARLVLREIVAEGEACDPEVVLSRCAAGFGCDPETATCGRERVCEDHMDNDGDGLIDCEDPDDCQGQAACAVGDGALGTSCDTSADCAATGGDPFCWSESEEGYPGGYCSEFCDGVDDDCGDNGLCLDLRLPSGNGICFLECDPRGGCEQPGYACTSVRGVTLCLPGCTSDDQCPTAGFCDQDTGDCTTDDEDCTDGTDNDGDQRADCEEFDCVADPACTEAYDTVCAEAVAATATTIGDNRDGTQVFSGSCVGVGGAHESLHTFSPGEPGQEGFLALQLSSSPDLGLYVRSACETMESELGCVDRAPGGGNEGLTVAVTGGESVTIFVDGFNSPAEAGPYTLLLDFFPTNETEANDDADGASPYVEPFAGQIFPELDQDYVSVTVDEDGATLTAEVVGLAGECEIRTIDPEVEIIDTDGVTQLAFNDDRSAREVCSRARASDLAAGTYFVRVGSSQEFTPLLTFPYQLVVEVAD